MRLFPYLAAHSRNKLAAPARASTSRPCTSFPSLSERRGIGTDQEGPKAGQVPDGYRFLLLELADLYYHVSKGRCSVDIYCRYCIVSML